MSDQLSNQAAAPVKDRLADSIKLVTEMIAIVRDVMADLRPIVLDEYGLEAALQSYLAKFEARYGIRVEFAGSNQHLPPLGAGLEMTILRITEEALVNIARHAHAIMLLFHCNATRMPCFCPLRTTASVFRPSSKSQIVPMVMGSC